MVSNPPFLPSCASGQQRNYEFSDRDLPIHHGSNTMVFSEKEHLNALPTIASTNTPAIIASTDNLPNEEANLMSTGSKRKRKNHRRNIALPETCTSQHRDEQCMGGNSGVGSKRACTVPSYNHNESLVTGARRDRSYTARDDGDHHPSYCNRNQFVGYEVMPKTHDRKSTELVVTQESASNPVFQRFAKGHGPHSHIPDEKNPLNDAEKQVQIDLTVHPSNSKVQLQVNPVMENVASGTSTVDDILYGEDLHDEDTEGVARDVDELSSFIPQLDEEDEQLMMAHMTNDPNKTCAHVLTDLLCPDDEAMNEGVPVASVGSKLASEMNTLVLSPVSSHRPESIQPPAVQVDDSASINPKKQFHVAPTSEGASCFITDSFSATPPISPQETWVGITSYSRSIPTTHMGHIPRPKTHTSIVPPPPPSTVDVTQSTPQPKGCFSSCLSTAGGEMVFVRFFLNLIPMSVPICVC